jgi:hypothetical protein
MWSIVVGEATQSWAERTGRSPNDFFNGLLSAAPFDQSTYVVAESLPGFRASTRRKSLKSAGNVAVSFRK